MNSWGDEPPIGAECFCCHEPIREGDTGGYITVLRPGGGDICAIHRECHMLSLVGHRWEVCSCTKYAGTTTIREAALLLAQRMRS